MELRLNLFGRFQLTRGQQPVALPTRKSESLFAFLALHPGHHSRGRLAEMFWPDAEPAAARASLRSALSSLRQKLDAEVFEIDREFVGIREGFPLQVDVAEFERHSADSGAQDPVTAATRALELYQGELLADHTDEWAVPARERLRESHRELLLLLAREMRSRGRYQDAIKAHQEVLRINPEFAPAYNYLGVVYGKLGKSSTEINSYKEAIRIDPDFAPAHYNLGYILFQKGNKAAALDEYKILKSLNEDAADKLFDLIYY